jgi:hypothetical protein
LSLAAPPSSAMNSQRLLSGAPSQVSATGRGSTFTIRLPRIVDAPKEVVAANPAHIGEAALKHH